MRDEGAPGTEGDASQFKVFIGGLSYQINDQDLKAGEAPGVSNTSPAGAAHPASSQHGFAAMRVSAAFERFDAISAKVMIDRYTGRSRGFGFVFFKTDESLKEAIAQMHEKVRPRRRRSPGATHARAQGATGSEQQHAQLAVAASAELDGPGGTRLAPLLTA